MIRRLALLVLPVALIAAPAVAVPGGDLDTLESGRYVCELPGDALGARGIHVPGEDFAIIYGSAYRAGNSGGTYLLTGDSVVMTSGPKQNERYHRMSTGFLRKRNAHGSDSDLRCVIGNRNNTFDDEPAVKKSATGTGAAAQ